MPRERLELDLSRALAALGQLDAQLRSSAASFSAALVQAVQPQAVKITADTSEVPPDIEGAVDAADTETPVIADTTGVAPEIEGAVDAADTEVTVTGDAAGVTGSIDAAVDAADSQVALSVDTGGLDQAKAKTEELRGSLAGVKDLATAVGVAFGAREVVNFFTESVGAASGLEEAINKVDVIFGKSAGVIENWSQSSSSAVLLSREAALDAAGQFGILFQQIGGQAPRAAATLSTGMVQLAADIASIQNIPVEDALLRLQSGLVGEIEPLRRVGVSFNAMQVEAKAAALGLVDAHGEVTEGGKLMARYQLILEATTKQQGDVARTADSWANVTRRMKAELEDARVEVGNRLLPELSRLATETGAGVLPAFAALAEQAAELASQAIPLLGSNAGTLMVVMQSLSAVLGVLSTVHMSGVVVQGLALSRILGKDTSDGMRAATLAVVALTQGLAFLSPKASETVASMATMAAVGFRIAGPWGAAIGALVGLTGAMSDSRTEAQRATEAIKEIAGATDRAVTRMAQDWAALIASGVFGIDASDAIGQIRTMAAQSEAGLGAAERFGRALAEAGVITEGQYTQALEKAAEAQNRSKDATERGKEIVNEAADAYEQAAAAADKFSESQERQVGVNLSAIEAQFAYTDAVNAVQFGLAVSAGNLDRATEAGVANTDAIIAGAQAAIAFGEALVAQGKPAAEAEAVLRGYVDSVLSSVPAGSAARGALEQFLGQLGLLPAGAGEAGRATTEQFADPVKTGVPKALQDTTTAASTYIGFIMPLTLGPQALLAGNKIGAQFIAGMASGIGNNIETVKEAAREAVRAAERAAREAGRIRSPSLLFAEIGTHLTEGLAVGMLDAMPLAQQASSRVVGATAAAASPAVLADPAMLSTLGAIRSALATPAPVVGQINGISDPAAAAELIAREVAFARRYAGV